MTKVRHKMNVTNDPKYQPLIRELKTREMSLKDILLLYRVPNTPSNRQVIYRMIDTLGNYLPVYETLPYVFKILTDKDVEEYQELYRRQKKMREEKKQNG